MYTLKGVMRHFVEKGWLPSKDRFVDPLQGPVDGMYLFKHLPEGLTRLHFLPDSDGLRVQVNAIPEDLPPGAIEFTTSMPEDIHGIYQLASHTREGIEYAHRVARYVRPSWYR